MEARHSSTNNSKYQEYFLLIGQTMPSSQLKYYMKYYMFYLVQYVMFVHCYMFYYIREFRPELKKLILSDQYLKYSQSSEVPPPSSALRYPQLNSVSINYLVLPGMQVSQDTARLEFFAIVQH